MEDCEIASLPEIGRESGEIALTEPIADSAGDPNLLRINLEQLLDQCVDRAQIAPAGAPLIKPIDEQSASELCGGRGEECTRRGGETAAALRRAGYLSGLRPSSGLSW